jgi:hypothetical protein
MEPITPTKHYLTWDKGIILGKRCLIFFGKSINQLYPAEINKTQPGTMKKGEAHTEENIEFSSQPSRAYSQIEDPQK